MLMPSRPQQLGAAMQRAHPRCGVHCGAAATCAAASRRAAPAARLLAPASLSSCSACIPQRATSGAAVDCQCQSDPLDLGSFRSNPKFGGRCEPCGSLVFRAFSLSSQENGGLGGSAIAMHLRLPPHQVPGTAAQPAAGRGAGVAADNQVLIQ